MTGKMANCALLTRAILDAFAPYALELAKQALSAFCGIQRAARRRGPLLSPHLLAPRRSIILRTVQTCRLLQLLVLIALVIAPFGRMGVAEAKAMPDHGMSAMGPHCPGPPAPDSGMGGRMAVDCMIACAAMAPAAAPFFAPPPAAEAAPTAMPASILAGIHPEADPPPPRLS